MRSIRRLAVASGVAGLCAVAIGAAVINRAIESAVLPSSLNDLPETTTTLTDIRGQPIAVLPTKLARDSRPAPLRKISPFLQMATVGIEDHRFWEHEGADWHAALGAAVRNARNRRIVSGASTITQQLVKIASGRTRRTLPVKFAETCSAMKLERDWDKPRILESYFNRLDYGNRRIGPEAAAFAYFGKSASSLTLPEAIFLAGLPQSPVRLNPWRNPERAVARYRLNVKRLAGLGLLPAGTNVETLLEHPPQIERNDPPAEARHFAEMAAKALPQKHPAVASTSLDLEVQHIVENFLRDHLAANGPRGVGDAAVVVIDNATGEVRALASDGSMKHISINAANVPRSAGSTLKPLMILHAIDRRLLTAATLLPDTPDAITEHYEDYDPQNYFSRSLGPVCVREALGNSLNVPAVVALSRIGARDMFATLRQWGLDFPAPFDAYGAGFILGNAPVRALELAGVYSAIARSGEDWKPKLFPRAPIESQRIASREACAIVADILCDNDARRRSFGIASPLNLGMRIPVKTGTSSGFRDGWCVGFSREHTVAVWAGNLDGQPMGEMLAVKSAAPLWNNIMRYLISAGDHEIPEPRSSEKLTSLAIAKETRLLPRLGEPVVREWFLAGTEPAENAAEWYEGNVLLLPQEYAAWCRSPQNHLGARVRGAGLRILFPKDGAEFALNPHLPSGQQTVTFSATESDCHWSLNGQPVSGSFQLRPGEWTVSAEKDGQVATSRFTVQ